MRLPKRIEIKRSVIAGIVLIFALSSFIISPPDASAHPKGLVFPVVGGGTFSNDFNSPRSGGQHNATDIMAPKGRHIVAAVAGTVTYMPITQPSWGYMLTIRDAGGFKYDYIHMNNDTPGTDDGQGTAYVAYAPDIYQGATVAQGQLLGYVGDSGNAENTAPHLHFEITDVDGSTKVNPYPYLLEARRLDAPAIYPAVRDEILPYGPYVYTQPSITMGKFETNGNDAIVVATGKGYAPHARVLRQDNTELIGFYAYSQQFLGGVQIATGDFDGDGKDEIVTAPGPGGGPHVRILKIDGSSVVEVVGFYAYSPSFTGGVQIAAGDVDGDGEDELMTAPGPGGGPHVRVLDVSGTSISEMAGYYAYNPNWTGGLDISSGDVASDGKDEVVTSAGPGAGAHVRIFTNNGTPIDDGFNAYPNSYSGARVSVGNIDKDTAKEEIVTAVWAGGSSQVKAFVSTGTRVRQAEPFESWWNGYYDIAAGDGVSYVATGANRRTTIREAVKD